MVLLVVVHETFPRLVDGPVPGVGVVEHVVVVLAAERSLDLDGLAHALGTPHGQRVGAAAVAAALAQAGLDAAGAGLKEELFTSKDSGKFFVREK